MPYIFLNNILESVVANYICPDCGNKTSAEQITITGMSSRGLDLHLVCGLCGLHSHLAAEVNTMASELLASQGGQQFFSEFIRNGGTTGATMHNQKNPNAKGINAADIAQIGEDIANAKTIEDLMG
jgi:predicted RNA-binding Zn-ribbon protein involved in translation (DUF1610 family)